MPKNGKIKLLNIDSSIILQMAVNVERGGGEKCRLFDKGDQREYALGENTYIYNK